MAKGGSASGPRQAAAGAFHSGITQAGAARGTQHAQHVSNVAELAYAAGGFGVGLATPYSGTSVLLELALGAVAVAGTGLGNPVGQVGAGIVLGALANTYKHAGSTTGERVQYAPRQYFGGPVRALPARAASSSVRIRVA